MWFFCLFCFCEISCLRPKVRLVRSKAWDGDSCLNGLLGEVFPEEWECRYIQSDGERLLALACDEETLSRRALQLSVLVEGVPGQCSPSHSAPVGIL